MEFEWDDDKRAANLAKHGVDFLDAVTLWRKPVIDPIAHPTVKQESRATAIGVIGDDEIIIAIVYTVRNGIVRLISARRARRNERKYYQDRFGRGT
jgi:uncharacterized protein